MYNKPAKIVWRQHECRGQAHPQDCRGPVFLAVEWTPQGGQKVKHPAFVRGSNAQNSSYNKGHSKYQRKFPLII